MDIDKQELCMGRTAVDEFENFKKDRKTKENILISLG
jgi:hypothetical protein